MAPKNAPSSAQGVSLTPGQVAAWAATFPESERVTAVAVAMAENSGMEVAKISPPNSDGTRDYGIWQINSVHRGLFDKYPDWWTYTNGKMAREIWDTQGWNAWTVYRSGKYAENLAAAQAAVGSPEGTIGDDPGEETGATREAEWFRDTKDALAQIGNAAAAIAGAVFKAAVWMADPHNWVRAALVGLGGALCVGALVMIAKPNKTLVEATMATPRAAVKAVR